MATLTPRDRAFLEDLFEMKSGYVLDFSNTTFSQFIAMHFNIDIYDSRYDYGSGSKANRMRAFWEIEDDETVGRLVVALLEHIDTEVALGHMSEDRFKPRVLDECKSIARRLLGGSSGSVVGTVAEDPQAIEAFLKEDIRDVSEAIRDIEADITAVMQQRLTEIEKILTEAPLAAIFLIGSTLEGVLLDVALQHASAFVAAPSAPARDGTVLPITSWRLSQLIDVAHETGFVADDVKRFSHALRDYRNFIHPRAQASAAFYPSPDTAKICFQVLKAAVTQIRAKVIE